MKKTKKVGKIITLAVLTIVILFYLLPNVTIIEQSLEIEAAPDRIFDLVDKPVNWTEWYTPLQDPSGVQIRYSGPVNGKGSNISWKAGNDENSGDMTIRNSRNKRVVTAVVNFTGRHSAIMNFRIKPVNDELSLLTITSRLRFPQDSLLHYLRMMFDRSEELNVIDYIENIGEIAVKQAEDGVVSQPVESFTYIGITDTCLWSEMFVRMGVIQKELMDFSERFRLATGNNVIAIYHRLGDTVVYELGIPANVNDIPQDGRIRLKTMPGMNHAILDYYGTYSTMGDGHQMIQQWLARQGKSLIGPPWEMYITTPYNEPDSNKWLTRIFYPIKP